MSDNLVLSLTYEEKKKYIEDNNPHKDVYDYLKKILKNIHINAAGLEEGSMMELVLKNKNNLIGWCWETAETAAVFFKDYDVVYRGNLYLDENNPEYYHSWIGFKYKNEEYVFDPSLAIIGRFKDYIEVFKPKIKGLVAAKLVRQEFINQIKEFVPKDTHTDYINDMKRKLNMNFSKEYITLLINKDNEVRITCKKDNPNDPLFCNKAGYRAELEDDSIKSIDAHYYRVNRH